MKIIRGNLLDLTESGAFDVAVHGCNCQHIMGAGIAKQIRERWPEAYDIDEVAFRHGRRLLGSTSDTMARRRNHTFWIVNAYTQPRPGPCVDYAAIATAFLDVKENHGERRIAYPKIGAGLGGGDWSLIAKIIDAALAGCDHTLVEYEP